MDNPTTFSGWLKQRRSALSVTQEELCDRIGFSPSMLRKLESGERRPSGQIAHLLADYFRIPSDEREAFVTFARSGSYSLQSQEGGSGPGTDDSDTPWRGAYTRQTNLPAVLTPLIGREWEMECVSERILHARTRLLTLTGAPGIGKTSLALQAASKVVHYFKDGVVFVDLSPIVDPHLVLTSVAYALDLKEEASLSLEIVLFQYVRERRMLLLIDNFEQVLDAAPDIVRLLQASPWLKIVITSREALHVRGERRYAVLPLAVPELESGRLPQWGKLGKYPSVQLFVERAQAAEPAFTLNESNAQAVAEICRRLDGLPLAIELIAARIAIFDPKVLLSRLVEDHELGLLRGQCQDLPARQRTLREAIAWSYNLLTLDEQRLFMRMAVFQGDATLEALEAVCNHDSALDLEVQEGVESLVSKSLLNKREGSGGESRFWMLETIHEYAREKLKVNAEAGIVQKEHALYFMKLAEETEPLFGGEQQEKVRARLEEEHDNIRAALSWAKALSSDSGDSKRVSEAHEQVGVSRLEIGLRLGGALLNFWRLGYFGEAREHLSALLELANAGADRESRGRGTGAPSTKPALATYIAKAHNNAGFLSMAQGDYAAARQDLEQGLSLGRAIDDKAAIATSLNHLGLRAHQQGDYPAARALFEEALALRRALGDKLAICGTVNNLAAVTRDLKEYALSRLLFEEGLTLARELGFQFGTAYALQALGHLLYLQGDYAAARLLIEEALVIIRTVREKRGIAFCLNDLGNLAQEDEDYALACSLHKESLIIQRETGDKLGIVASLIGLALVSVRHATCADTQGVWHDGSNGQSELERGARVLGAVEALCEITGVVPFLPHRTPYERGVAIARAQLDEEQFKRLWDEGRGMTMERAIAYALDET